jgi:hypothetical protein
MSTEPIEQIDKSQWRDGPWKTEPDRKEWKHNGFHCLITRVSNLGHLCGYVAIPPGHPWHGKSYNDLQDVEVHGGLTYSEMCSGRICHVPDPGEPDGVWWLGFDHAHSGDMSPGRDLSSIYQLRSFGSFFSDDDISDSYGEYRDMDYVIKGTESLADQASKVSA